MYDSKSQIKMFNIMFNSLILCLKFGAVYLTKVYIICQTFILQIKNKCISRTQNIKINMVFMHIYQIIVKCKGLIEIKKKQTLISYVISAKHHNTA